MGGLIRPSINSVGQTVQTAEVDDNAITSAKLDLANCQPIRLARNTAVMTINGAGSDALSDSAWADWDLDTDLTVPADAKAIVFVIKLRDSGAAGAGAYFGLRKNGETNNGHLFYQDCIKGDDVWTEHLVIIEFDSAHKVEYSVEASGANTFDSDIKQVGWIVGDAS